MGDLRQEDPLGNLQEKPNELPQSVEEKLVKFICDLFNVSNFAKYDVKNPSNNNPAVKINKGLPINRVFLSFLRDVIKSTIVPSKGFTITKDRRPEAQVLAQKLATEIDLAYNGTGYSTEKCFTKHHTVLSRLRLGEKRAESMNSLFGNPVDEVAYKTQIKSRLSEFCDLLIEIRDKLDKVKSLTMVQKLINRPVTNKDNRIRELNKLYYELNFLFFRIDEKHMKSYSKDGLFTKRLTFETSQTIEYSKAVIDAILTSLESNPNFSDIVVKKRENIASVKQTELENRYKQAFNGDLGQVQEQTKQQKHTEFVVNKLVPICVDILAGIKKESEKKTVDIRLARCVLRKALMFIFNSPTESMRECDALYGVVIDGEPALIDSVLKAKEEWVQSGHDVNVVVDMLIARLVKFDENSSNVRHEMYKELHSEKVVNVIYRELFEQGTIPEYPKLNNYFRDSDINTEKEKTEQLMRLIAAEFVENYRKVFTLKVGNYNEKMEVVNKIKDAFSNIREYVDSRLDDENIRPYLTFNLFVALINLITNKQWFKFYLEDENIGTAAVTLLKEPLINDEYNEDDDDEEEEEEDDEDKEYEDDFEDEEVEVEGGNKKGNKSAASSSSQTDFTVNPAEKTISVTSSAASSVQQSTDLETAPVVESKSVVVNSPPTEVPKQKREFKSIYNEPTPVDKNTEVQTETIGLLNDVVKKYFSEYVNSINSALARLKQKNTDATKPEPDTPYYRQLKHIHTFLTAMDLVCPGAEHVHPESDKQWKIYSENYKTGKIDDVICFVYSCFLNTGLEGKFGKYNIKNVRVKKYVISVLRSIRNSGYDESENKRVGKDITQMVQKITKLRTTIKNLEESISTRKTKRLNTVTQTRELFAKKTLLNKMIADYRLNKAKRTEIESKRKSIKFGNSRGGKNTRKRVKNSKK